MSLTKKQRFEIIRNLTVKIQSMGEADGFFFLKEYTRDENLFYVYGEGYYADQPPVHIDFSYNSILELIRKLNDETVYEMYKDQFPEEAKMIDFSEKEGPLYHLSTDKIGFIFQPFP